MSVTAFAARRSRLSRASHWSRRPLTVLAVGATILGVAAGVAGVAAANPTPAASGEFVPVTPARLVNSAAGKGWSGKLAPNRTRTVTVSGVAGVPASNVLAVMMHVTTSGGKDVRPNGNGNVWAWPAGAQRPRYATVANAPSGASADNTAIVSLGDAGRISFYHGGSGTPVNVIVDVEGYVTRSSTIDAGATFAPLTPSRIVDTRSGAGGRKVPLTSKARLTVRPLGVGGVPTSNVSAVALNLGAQAATTNCWVQVQPSGTSATNASYPRVAAYASYASQQLAVVAPGASDGSLTFSTSCRSVNVFADVEGYYLSNADGSSGDVYVPINRPTRVIDTRQNLGIRGKMTAGRVVKGRSAVPVTGVGGRPASTPARWRSVSARPTARRPDRTPSGRTARRNR